MKVKAKDLQPGDVIVGDGYTQRIAEVVGVGGDVYWHTSDLIGGVHKQAYLIATEETEFRAPYVDSGVLTRFWLLADEEVEVRRDEQ